MSGDNSGFFANFFGRGGEATGGEGGAPSQEAGQQPNGEQQPNGDGQQQPVQYDSHGQPVPNGQSGQATEPDAFDIYNKMFENKDSGDEDAPPELALGNDTLAKVVDQLDFTSGIDKQLLDQVQAGDLSALPQLLNHVGKQAYSTSMKHNSALVNQFVGQRSEYDSKQIAPAIRSSLTESQLDTELGEAAQTPAIRAQMTDAAQRLAKTYPDASPEWVAKQAKDYVIESASRMLGVTSEELKSLKQNQQQQQQSEQARNVDWDNYFNR